MAEIHHERVLRLVELIYDAANDPAAWKVFLDEIVAMTGGAGGSLSGFDFRVASAFVQIGVGNMGGEFQREYAAFAHLDPYVLRGRALGMFKAGVIGLGEDLVPFQELERTEFYQAFATRHGFVGGLAAIISSTGTSGAALGICRSQDRLFDATHIELVRVLMPHLQRAWHLHVQLVDREDQRSALVEALERLNLHLIIVREGGTVVYVNESARTLVAASDGLVIERGLLRSARSQDTKALRELITTALTSSPLEGNEPAGVLHLQRPSGRRPLRVVVSPLPRNEKLAISQPRALVYVVDPEGAIRPDRDVLRRAYGLSHAESEVAALLMHDKSAKEVSQILGTTVHTVRFHIKQLFAKTGVSRQSALVRLLTTTSHIRLPDRSS